MAGGPDKCRALIEEFGFDAAVDRRTADFAERLADACPNGVDIYFENVGGAVLDAVLPLFNQFARVTVCGFVAHYHEPAPAAGPDRPPGLMRNVLAPPRTPHGSP